MFVHLQAQKEHTRSHFLGNKHVCGYFCPEQRKLGVDGLAGLVVMDTNYAGCQSLDNLLWLLWLLFKSSQRIDVNQ